MEKLFGDILRETTRSAVKGVTDDFIYDNLDKIKTDMVHVALVGKTEYKLIIDITFDEWYKSRNTMVADYEEVIESIFQALKIWAEADGVSVSKDEYDETVLIFQWANHPEDTTSTSFGGKLESITERSIDIIFTRFQPHLIDEVKNECLERAGSGHFNTYIHLKNILYKYIENIPDLKNQMIQIWDEYKNQYIDYVGHWANDNNINVMEKGGGDIKLEW